MSRFRLRVRNREIALPDGGEVTIGRDPECDVVVADRLASRRHAIVRGTIDGPEIVPEAAARAGVRVNAEAVVGARRLAHGDRIQIGAELLLVLDTLRPHTSNAPTVRMPNAPDALGSRKPTR